MGPVSRTKPPDPPALGEVALRYAEHGWPVVPLHTPHAGGCSCRAERCGSAGKHPRTVHGLRDASTDAGQVRGWWRRWPDANLGVITGAGSGLLVLDVDLPEGPASLHRLEAAHAPLPATCTQRTGSGGRQLLFAHPGRPVGNRARLEPGIDVRGDGGYIVVPPSRHACGDRYQWISRMPPAPPPDWLLALLDRTRSPDVPTATTTPVALPAGDRHRRYAASALQRELASLATAVEGSRNHTLNRAAFNLGQLSAAGLLDPDQVTAALEKVAIGIGLGAAETRRTIASGLAAGRRHPRPLPQPPTPDQSISASVRRIAARHR
jgi:hypothetical protein